MGQYTTLSWNCKPASFNIAVLTLESWYLTLSPTTRTSVPQSLTGSKISQKRSLIIWSLYRLNVSNPYSKLITATSQTTGTSKYFYASEWFDLLADQVVLGISDLVKFASSVKVNLPPPFNILEISKLVSLNLMLFYGISAIVCYRVSLVYLIALRFTKFFLKWVDKILTVSRLVWSLPQRAATRCSKLKCIISSKHS